MMEKQGVVTGQTPDAEFPVEPQPAKQASACCGGSCPCGSDSKSPTTSEKMADAFRTAGRRGADRS